MYKKVEVIPVTIAISAKVTTNSTKVKPSLNLLCDLYLFMI